LLIDLVRASAFVAATRSRNGKRDALAQCLRALGRGEIRIGVCYLSGRLPQGRIGVGPAALRDAARTPPAAEPTLDLSGVHQALDRLVVLSSKGVTAERRRALGALFARCVPDEQRFLVRLLLGELRQGALDGVMIEALATASGCPGGAVRRASMLSGDLARVAEVAFAEGAAGVARFGLEPGEPVESMLAQTADGVEEAMRTLGRAVLDFKMDGARVQVHKVGSDVAVFSRQLNDVAVSVPEVVEAVARLPARSLVLDGEAIALGPDGRALAFQTTMRRFGRRKGVSEMRESIPLSVFFFDCLHVDGEDLLDRSTLDRLQILDEVAPAPVTMPRALVSDAGEAAAFLARALDAGHEGVMAKHPNAPYEAGNRGAAWLKVKRTHTLDLVILAAEWGSGRRRGWLSNLHLGARDPVSGGFAMLGKTFKGLTDEMLAWQTQALLAREVARDAHTVFVEPVLVVEVAFNEVQTSPRYASGLALRFARVKRFRPDKSVEAANTLDEVRAIHAMTAG